LTAWHRHVEHSSRLRNPGTHAFICLFPHPFVSFSFYIKYSEIDVSRLEEIEVDEYLESNMPQEVWAPREGFVITQFFIPYFF